jgi:hypothetical protein
MDLEMVFNELSLRIPAENIPTAKQRMSQLIETARSAGELGVSPIIRTHSEFYAGVLANNYSLYDWLRDSSVDKDEIRFIVRTVKTPFLTELQNPDIEDRNTLSDFYCEGVTCNGLGIAYLLESLALSLKSEPYWESNIITLETTWLEDDNLTSDTVTVFHASSKEHVQGHISWIQERLKTGVSDGLDLWNRREELFPSLSFCENVCEQLQSIGSGNPVLLQILSKLFALEQSCKNWTEGAFNLDTLPCKASPESESRLKRLQSQLIFRCPDGVNRNFSLHVRMTPGAWRLYFSTELRPGKIVIGYIGLKIQ